ncbi:pilus assembly FimT family protein [Shewanella electrodiphila]|uniref:pilus assembly FimT family protein n=1 Tax=Shewanella electrodiphila TaxID=934143 RepID=UPI0024B1E672|nr:prepilin-type N-terminal cleavage/methylation domain-containing protein [Shewanella electrodiphila]
MANHVQQEQGFTLIELVVVIIILAVLAVVAAPKFINLSNDAKKNSLITIGGAMQSGLDLVYSRAVIEGKNIGADVIDINGTDVPIFNGYPSVRGSDSFVDINAQVKAWLDIDTVDRDTANANRDIAVLFTDKASSAQQIFIFFTEDYDDKSVTFKCTVLYQNQQVPTPLGPSVTVETDEC